MASSSLVVRCSEIRELVVDADDGSSACMKMTRSVAPWLMLQPELEQHSSSVFKFYRLAEGDVVQVQLEEQEQQMPDIDSVCLGSVCKGWLACIQPKDCSLFLFNPLSGKTIQLPSIETLPSVKGVIRNKIHPALVESFLNFQSVPITSQHMSTYIVKKMVFSSPDFMEEDCIAMVIFGPHDRLGFCRRPAGPNSSWAALDGPLRKYTQIVFHTAKKLFFALTESSDLEAWDLHNDPIRRYLVLNESGPISALDEAEFEFMSSYCWDIDYLVYDHQSEELFLVTRYVSCGIADDGTPVSIMDNAHDEYPYKTRTFYVFRLDFMGHDRVELQYLQQGSSLGNNRAFFIGSNPGFALSTTMFPELRPNSIYFTDNVTWAYNYRLRPNCGGHDLGIYDYKEGSFLSCYYPIDVDKIKRILPAPLWFTPADFDATCLATLSL